jgi:hypothetical protein
MLRRLISSIVLAFPLVLVAPPANAASPCETATGDPSACATTLIIGHRCRHWLDDSVTNENTVAALRYVAEESPTAGCEIDVWRTADGVPIVHHDKTWNRTIDPTTLVGIPAQVVETTSAQVSQMRTRGGEPVATLRQMIRAAGRYDVPLVIETKNFTPGRKWMEIAERRGAVVWWHHSPVPENDCVPVMLRRIAPAGAVVGVKGTRDCDYLTPAEVRDRGTFLVTNLQAMSRAQVTTHRNVGLLMSPYLAREQGWANLLWKGVRMMIVHDTAEAAAWFGQGTDPVAP